MNKRGISSSHVPHPAGPYTPDIAIHDYIFVSGQRPQDPETGNIPADIAGQTRQVLTNMKRVLEAADASLQDVVKVTVYLADLADFAAMNEIYQQFFDHPYPARTTIGVALRGILVEIDAVAIRGAA